MKFRVNIPRAPSVRPLPRIENQPGESSAVLHDEDAPLRTTMPISASPSSNPLIVCIDLFDILQIPRRALNTSQNRETPSRTALLFPSSIPPYPDMIPFAHNNTHMTSNSEDEDEIPTPESFNRKRRSSDHNGFLAPKRRKNESHGSESGHRSLSTSPKRLRSQKKGFVARSAEIIGGNDIADNLEQQIVPVDDAKQRMVPATINEAKNLTSPAPFLAPETISAEEEIYLDRIHTAISYTRAQLATGFLPAVIDYFNLTHASPTEALNLLRRAHYDGHATLISSSPAHETYSIKIPPGPASRKFGGFNPQWWAGLSRAEMKAGPFRDESDVRKAVGDVKGMLKRREKSEKSGKLHIETKIVAEGLRRQTKGLRMWDEEGRGRKGDEPGKWQRQQGREEHTEQGVREFNEKVNEEEQIPKRMKQKRISRHPAPAGEKRSARRVRFVDDSDDRGFDSNSRKMIKFALQRRA